MEYLDIVDENNNPTGGIAERDIVHSQGLWHREVSIWIMNEDGKILLQKRSATKKNNPNKWAVVAGHVDNGEDIAVAAKRELREEIGIQGEIEFLFVEKLDESTNKRFMYNYFLKTNTKIEDFEMQYEELSELQYISIEELERIVAMKDENFTFTKRKYMPKLIEKLRTCVQ